MANFFQNTRKPEGFGGKIMVALMNGGHAPVAKWGMSHIAPKSTDTVLDAGCGGGANIALLLKKVVDGKVFGVDYSEVSVNKSLSLNKKAVAEGKCEIRQCSVSSLPFGDETFDIITAFETVYFWQDLKNTFAEVRRTLKTGGTFMICNESDGHNPADEKWTSIIDGMSIYTAETLKSILTEAGFSKVDVDTNSKKHWLCVTAEK